ncbi:MAG: hypothetical protein ACR2IL_01975 [Chitinophagaceae bacterium]
MRSGLTIFNFQQNKKKHLHPRDAFFFLKRISIALFNYFPAFRAAWQLAPIGAILLIAFFFPHRRTAKQYPQLFDTRFRFVTRSVYVRSLCLCALAFASFLAL